MAADKSGLETLLDHLARATAQQEGTIKETYRRTSESVKQSLLILLAAGWKKSQHLVFECHKEVWL